MNMHGKPLVISLALGLICIASDVVIPAENPRSDLIAKCAEQFLEIGAQQSDLTRMADICQAIPTQEPVPLDTQAIERGQKLYVSHGCAFCHGEDTRGGRGGPSLLVSRRVLLDRAGETIAPIILNGVPNTAMKAFALRSDELTDIAKFLHSIPLTQPPVAALAQPVVTGDILAGRERFNSKCSQCHSPSQDLAGVGTKHSNHQLLQQAWLMPKGSTPPAVSVTTGDGKTTEGTLIHIDEFSVTVGLSDGSQRTFPRSGSKPVVNAIDPLSAHRALLPTYSDKDIHDITAYLSTLAQLPKNSSDGQTRETDASLSKPSSRTEILPDDALLHPRSGSWPTYSGDYSGRRFSPLKQIGQRNVAQLALAWTTRLIAGPNDLEARSLTAGGEGTGEQFMTQADVRGSILQVAGMLYLSTPDNAWSVDARDGRIRWHFHWKTRGGSHFGNRGLGMWRNYLYMQTPDNYVVCLDARTGIERWHVQIAPVDDGSTSSQAPVIVGNQVLVGNTGGQRSPGFLLALDVENGAIQWKRYSVPMNAGDKGLNTWSNVEAARLGGGGVWVPGVYDSETRLYIYGTGNPEPVFISEPRGNGAALFTCSLVAINVADGSMAWYYQVSPNDTNDWDASQTPILADLPIKGVMRKVVMTAARNGYFFVLDRTNGNHLLTSKFSRLANWALPILSSRGEPVRDVKKDSETSGALVSPNFLGAANWIPASYSPDYGLVYVTVAESWAMHYRIPIEQRGKKELLIDADTFLYAIDPSSGELRWSIQYPTRGMSFSGLYTNGILTTAGGLLFTGDGAGNLVARDPGNGKPLWHARLGRVSNAPQTYSVDDRQYILVARGDSLYAFSLPESNESVRSD
jgi:alcohol dehydrogenase (cytochrome c)